jgi:hypothetical protein
METRDHSKNGVSPKNLRSRGKLLMMICFTLFVACFIFSGCKKDKDDVDDKAKLSPPAWTIGEWEYTGSEMTLYFKFMSNDIVHRLTDQYGTLEVKFSDLRSSDLKETIKTDSIYQLTIVVNTDNYTRLVNYHVKRGDGTYIDYYPNNSTYFRSLQKK